MVGLVVTADDVWALCDNGRTGPKLGNHTEFHQIVRREYDQDNPGCPGGPTSVTVLFNLGAASNPGSEVPGILSQMRASGLVPVIRLYTATVASGFERWDTADAEKMRITRDAARNLGDAIRNAGFADGEVIVYLGNEINNPDEWPYPNSTSIDDAIVEERIKDFAKFYNVFADAAATNYKLYLPPLNAYYSTGPTAANYNTWVDLLIANTRRKDGAALTIYNATADAINQDYNDMRSAYAGVGEFTISEVGPRVGGALLDGTSDVTEWERIMTDVFKSVKAGSILGGAVHINTSFFLNCRNEDPNAGLDSYLVVIHEDGTVHIEGKGGMPQCSGSSPGGGECAPITAPPPGGGDIFSAIANIISGLFSFLNPPTEYLAGNLTNTLDSIPVEYDPRNHDRKIVGGSDALAHVALSGSAGQITVTGIVPASIPFTIPGLSFLSQEFFQKEAKGGFSTGADYNISTDKTSGRFADLPPAEVQTLKAHWLGFQNDKRAMQYVIDSCKTGTCDHKFIMANVGKLDVIGPRMAVSQKSLMLGKAEWKKRPDARRDDVFCSTLSGLKAAILGSPGDMPQLFEYTAGVMFPAEGKGPEETWCGSDCGGSPCRVIYGFDLMCANTSYTCPGISAGEKADICTRLIGPNYAQGGPVSADSWLGQRISPEKRLLRLPSELALYGGPQSGGQRCIYLEPYHGDGDVSSATLADERIGRREHDPSNETNPDNRKANPLTVNIMAVHSAAKEFAEYFSSSGSKRYGEGEYELSSNVCPKDQGVAGQVAASLGNVNFSTDLTQGGGYTLGELIERDNPDPSPFSDSQATDRSITFTVDVPKYLADLSRFAVSPREGVTRFWLTHEVNKAFDQVVGGSPVYQIPQLANFTCTGSAQCDDTFYTPLLGGLLVGGDKYCGLTSEATLPREADLCGGTGASAILRNVRDIASGKTEKSVAVNPWQELASFQSPTHGSLSRR